MLLIRPVRAAEAETLFVLHRAATLDAYRHIFPPELYPFPDEAMRRHWLEAVATHGPAGQLVVAELDGRVVGAVVAPPGRLENLFVTPEDWRGGIGSALHDAALAVTREAGLKSCRLAVLEANIRAREFYERRGWLPDGSRRASRFRPHPVELGYVRSTFSTDQVQGVIRSSWSAGARLKVSENSFTDPGRVRMFERVFGRLRLVAQRVQEAQRDHRDVPFGQGGRCHLCDPGILRRLA